MIGEHVIEREDHAAGISPDRGAPLDEERFAECVRADAWARSTAPLDARVAKHLLARALRGERCARSRAWHVLRLRHVDSSRKNTKPPPLWRGSWVSFGAFFALPVGLLSPAWAE
jgi:hypothetical protein